MNTTNIKQVVKALMLKTVTNPVRINSLPVLLGTEQENKQQRYMNTITEPTEMSYSETRDFVKWCEENVESYRLFRETVKINLRKHIASENALHPAKKSWKDGTHAHELYSKYEAIAMTKMKKVLDDNNVHALYAYDGWRIKEVDFEKVQMLMFQLTIACGYELKIKVLESKV